MEIDWSFPHGGWQTLASDSGVVLRGGGAGETLFIFPGMEGSGESCLHVVVPAVEQASRHGRPYRLILVDYAAEEHSDLDVFVSTIAALARSVVDGNHSCTYIGQSFGNILALEVARRQAMHVGNVAMLSPFMTLPVPKTWAALLTLSLTPAVVYRATIKPIGRYLFGPVGDQPEHPFFDALQRTPPAVIRRRTQWVMSRPFDNLFTGSTAQTKIWLGNHDRLIDLKKQQVFFKDLAQSNRSYTFAVIKGSGHVTLPRRVVQTVRQELSAWLM